MSTDHGSADERPSTDALLGAWPGLRYENDGRDRPTDDHGAAGFCTDHGQPAARPTTVAEVVEVAYRAHLEARKGAPLAPGEFEATRSRVETKWMAAVLAAIGYADMLAEIERPRTTLRRLWEERQQARGERDALAATVARVEAVADNPLTFVPLAGVDITGVVSVDRLRAALHPKGTT